MGSWARDGGVTEKTSLEGVSDTSRSIRSDGARGGINSGKKTSGSLTDQYISSWSGVAFAFVSPRLVSPCHCGVVFRVREPPHRLQLGAAESQPSNHLRSLQPYFLSFHSPLLHPLTRFHTMKCISLRLPEVPRYRIQFSSVLLPLRSKVSLLKNSSRAER